jgi:hypothetical protein
MASTPVQYYRCIIEAIGAPICIINSQSLVAGCPFLMAAKTVSTHRLFSGRMFRIVAVWQWQTKYGHLAAIHGMLQLLLLME